MYAPKRFSLPASVLLLVACASQPPQPVNEKPAKATPATSAISTTAAQQTFTGPGHNYANAVQFSGLSNPLAFSQRQQEWLWLHYRDWKKQGQAMREKDGVQYDEVTLINKRGETRVIYFRMPNFNKR